MAFEGLKLRYPNTTAFVLGTHVNFLIVCLFISSYFAIYYDAPSPSEIDAIPACAEKTPYNPTASDNCWCPISAW